MEQEVRHIVICHKNVHQAVVVVVGEGNAHAAADVCGDARFGGDILESPVAPVPVKRVGEPLEILWVAVDPQITVTLAAVAIKVRRPVRIIDYE